MIENHIQKIILFNKAIFSRQIYPYPHIFSKFSFTSVPALPTVYVVYTTMLFCLNPPAMYPMDCLSVTQPISQIDPNHAPFDPLMLHLPVSGLREGIPPSYSANPGVFVDSELPSLPPPFSSQPQKMRHITQGLYPRHQMSWGMKHLFISSLHWSKLQIFHGLLLMKLKVHGEREREREREE